MDKAKDEGKLILPQIIKDKNIELLFVKETKSQISKFNEKLNTLKKEYIEKLRLLEAERSAIFSSLLNKQNNLILYTLYESVINILIEIYDHDIGSIILSFLIPNAKNMSFRNTKHSIEDELGHWQPVYKLYYSIDDQDIVCKFIKGKFWAVDWNEQVSTIDENLLEPGQLLFELIQGDPKNYINLTHDIIEIDYYSLLRTDENINIHTYIYK